MHLAFLEQLRLIDGLVPMSGHNLTFETVMHDFFLPLRLIPLEGPLLIGVDTPWVGVVSKVLLVVSVVAVLWATRAEEFGTRVRQRLFLLYIAAIFFGPLAWIHYYVLPLLLLPGLALVARSPVFPALAILVVAGFSTPVMLGIHLMESGKAATVAFHAQTATGKLNAVTTPTGPSGCHCSIIRCRGRSDAIVRPWSCRERPTAKSQMSIISWTSPRPSVLIFPISRDTSSPSGSL